MGALGPSVPALSPGDLLGVVAPLAADNTVMVTIGDIPLLPEDIFYIGVAPCCAGLYQLVARVPDGLADGDHEVVLTVNGISSPPGPFISVATPAAQ